MSFFEPKQNIGQSGHLDDLENGVANLGLNQSPGIEISLTFSQPDTVAAGMGPSDLDLEHRNLEGLLE